MTIAYNANLAPSSVTTAAGDGSISSTVSYSYDGYGNLATSTNPLGRVTTYVYDADRELTGVVGPDPDGSGPRTPVAARVADLGERLGQCDAGLRRGPASGADPGFHHPVGL
jgi:YD repeat-containing protein